MTTLTRPAQDVGGGLSLIDESRLGRAIQLQGSPDLLSVGEATIDGETRRVLFVHPPTAVAFRVPGGAGELSFGLAVHPDVWEHPESGPCEFTVLLGEQVVMRAIVDTAANPGERCWHDVRLDLPAGESDVTVLSFMTRGVEGESFRWALFSEPRFEPASGAGLPAVAPAPTAAAPEQAVIDPQTTVFFMHVPRTAGTTLRRIIQRQVDPTAVHPLYDDRPWELVKRFAKLPEPERARMRLVLGHYVFGLHEHAVGPSTYIAVLRDPVERIVSDYHYILANPDHVHHRLVTAENISLRDFVDDARFCPSNDNGMVRGVAGIRPVPPFRSVGPEALERAKQNVARHFAVLGLTERFDETLGLFRRNLGWTSLSYQKENIGRSRPPREEIPQEVLDHILETNALDVEFYRFAALRFSDQVRRAGPRFAEEVSAQRRLNEHLYVLNIAGQEQISAGDFRAACATLETATGLDSRFPLAHHNLSVARFHLGEVDAAFQHAAIALGLDPFDRHIILHAGNLLARSGRPERARALYQFYLLKHNPYDVEIAARLEECERSGPEALAALLGACTRLGV